MTETTIAIMQLVGGFAILVGCGYWGGKLQQNVNELCRMGKDHEERLREVEHRL